MTASRFLRAGALALASLACARPHAAGTGTTASQAPARPAVAHMPREEPIAHAPLLRPTTTEAPIDAAETSAVRSDDFADASLLEASRGSSRLPPADLSELVQALVEAALSARETPAPHAPITEPPAWASRDGSDQATYIWQAAAPRAEETDYQREEERLKAIGAVYRVQLRRLEGHVRFAEQAVQSAEAELSKVLERPKLTVGEPMVTGTGGPSWCGTEDPVESAPPAPDPAAVLAAAEERLAQARAELKRARDTEDDLLTKIRRERIPLSYVL